MQLPEKSSVQYRFSSLCTPSRRLRSQFTGIKQVENWLLRRREIGFTLTLPRRESCPPACVVV